MESDEQQIRAVIEDWHRRSKEGDVDAVMALMTDDAIFLRCGHPPMTKREFAEGARAWAGKVELESGSDIKEVHASGDVAYAWSYVSVSMKAPGQEAMKREGNVLTVFRKIGGKWLLARDANFLPGGKQEKA